MNIRNNRFAETRGGVFLLGFGPGANSGEVLVKGYKFQNTLVGEIYYGFGVDYPVKIVSNTFDNDQAPSNGAVFAIGATGDLTIKKIKLGPTIKERPL